RIEQARRSRNVLFERDFRRKDGTMVPIEATIRRLADGGVFGILRDITARRNTEASLQRSEARYRILLEQAADAIMIADADGQMLDANVSACELTGYSHDELVRLSVPKLYVAEDRPAVEGGFASALAGLHRPVERRVLRKDG